jgi:G patch domain-containing protein 1
MSHKRSRAAFESDENPPSHAPFAIYGTPLPAYDPDARDDGSYVPVWKQEVTDEHGRKRLHGAFTGGFSAGYFNTVGSKEGWTPSAFVSSRSDRAKDRKKDGEQKVEDFMDDEDLAEREESQLLETQGTFAGLGAGGEGKGEGGMFADLFRTTGETMGVKLLQRMGWRQGQGIGPKVRRKAQGDAKGEVHLFAPDNSRMIGFRKKTDRKGIGFAGEGKLGGNDNGKEDDGDSDRDARILHSSRSKVSIKPKQKVKKTGFGVGVLNDTGSDEEDAYDMGPKISYTRIIGGDKKKKQGGLLSTNANPAFPKPTLTSSKKLTQRSTALNGFRKCHDGRLPLDGFILATAALSITQENKYPPPTVPPDWKPSKLAQSSSTAALAPYISTADAAKTSTLDPKSRAALLNEPQLPGKSVFSFLTPATRDRLASASGNTRLPPALSEKAPTGFTQSEAEKQRTLWDYVPDLDNDTATAALHRGGSGWMPYAEDEDKRERYRYFLSLRAGLANDLPPRPTGMGVEEWSKELREFSQAAEVFKPISGLMATRFTSETATGGAGPRLASDAPDTQAGGKKEEDPAEKAARMGMFGPLTRSRMPFYPTRLLCKRFNVRPPASVAVDPGESGAGEAGSAGGASAATGRLDVVSQASIDRMMREASFKHVGGSGFVSGGVEGGDDVQMAGREERAKVDVERNEALEGQKAGEAVFKAIFGSDDEDDE